LREGEEVGPTVTQAAATAANGRRAVARRSEDFVIVRCMAMVKRPAVAGSSGGVECGAMPAPLLDWILTPHAKTELQRRAIEPTLIAEVLAAPERRSAHRAGRDVFESQHVVDGKAYLVRVFVDVDRHPAEVVTAYRTSKIGKYWGSDR
jgi:hypothetical protein